MDHLRQLSTSYVLPNTHVDYLKSLKSSGFEPQVIYDIGACVLHWTKDAKKLWPNATYVLFDAFAPAEFLYIESGHPYFLGVLSDQTGKQVEWHQNDIAPTGNSYYREDNDGIFPPNQSVSKTTVMLDDVVAQYNFPLPDLIKVDVQGSEVDVIKGCNSCQEN